MVLNSYDWTDMPANSPGDVCQAFWFAPEVAWITPDLSPWRFGRQRL
jgi:hypothetical protein